MPIYDCFLELDSKKRTAVVPFFMVQVGGSQAVQA